MAFSTNDDIVVYPSATGGVKPVMNSAVAGLQKAYLTIVPASSSAVTPHGGQTLEFKFNPTEYKISKKATWHRTPAQRNKAAGPAQWGGTEPRAMSLTIFLDASDSADGDVESSAKLLFSCCAPTKESLAAKLPSGPHVLFGWGKTTTFTAFVRSVELSYTMFRPDGRPYRATATVQIEEVEVPTAGQNPTSGALSAVRTHTVVSGDSLPLIAYEEYRDPNRWRLLADANAIDDPLRLKTGTTLLVPAADGTQSES